MPNYNNTEEMKKQYASYNNLGNRVLLHQLYSVNKLGWTNWVFQNYQLSSNQHILELGCGNAGIWSSNINKIPKGIMLKLTDFSEGMLEVAKNNTAEIGDSVEYSVVDAQSIPYGEDVFDVVIANHMLYHVPNIHKALNEISRVIKPSGVFYATTVGKENLKEINDLLHGFDARVDFAVDHIAEAFGLETGEKILSQHFNQVELLRYDDSLHITDPKPLVDYILSSQSIGNVNEIIVGAEIERFSRYIDTIFSKSGYINVKKDAGMFVSSCPKRG